MTRVKHKPRSLLRWALRLPIWLYRLQLGWLLGERFLLLTHIGRTSGRPRHTVLEVLRRDRATETYIVASSWGMHADWWRNIQHNPDVTITVGGHKRPTLATCLSITEGAQELWEYAQHHPRAFRVLTSVLTDQRMHGTAECCHELAQSVPIIALRPRKAPS
jgi:deazaflavin-dependent oxidoreductase (nitroreductase family)